MANSKFHHEEIYRGTDLLKKLARQVVVCGCGAIGSNLIETLARQGFSRIRVIDFDRVDTHNIGTQTFDENDIGALKVQAIQNRIFRVCGIEVEVVSKKLDALNVKKLSKDAALVVDGFDNNEARQIVQTYCRAQKIPCLHAGLNTDYGEVAWDEVYTVPKAGEGDICDYPLARNLIMIVVSIAAEEIVDFFTAQKPRKRNWSFTLKDLKIGSYQ